MNTVPTNGDQNTDTGEGRVWIRVYLDTEDRRSVDDMLRSLDTLKDIRVIPFHQTLNRKPWER